MSINGGKATDLVSYVETLEEAVLDEGQVVTYKWLCHKLGTKANTAKQMLFAFVESQKKLGRNLQVMYLLAGMKKPENTANVKCSIHSICIVPALKLEEVKSTFSLVTSIHVYSVHTSAISDNDVLYSVDYDLASKLDIKRASAIVCTAATLRSDAFVAMETDKKRMSVQPTIQKSTMDANGSGDMVTNEENVLAKTATSINKPKENKGGALSSMFATMAMRKRNPVNQPRETLAVEGASKREEEDAMKIKTRASGTADALPQTQETTVKKDNKKGAVKSKTVDCGDKRVTLGKEGQDKRKKSKDKFNPPKKRMRRIIEMLDSSSDEEDPCEPHRVEESEEEDPIPPMRAVEFKVENDEESGDPNRPLRKHRRLVEKTGLDEDGYLSTQKKWVECSDGEPSDDDENGKRTTMQGEMSAKHKNISGESAAVVMTKTKNPAKVSLPLAKNKQATLTSFFKRK